MKKLLILFLCAVTFVACDKEGLKTGGGSNPLAEPVLSGAAAPGEEVVVQWNGFGQSAKIFLVDAEGNRYDTEIKVQTSSGLIFVVPSGLMPGEYSVFLEQGKNIGSVQVLESDIPVSGISFPAAVAPGEIFVFAGVGLDSSYGLILSSSSGQSKLDSQMSSAGLDCMVPADFKTGVYTLILTDGENEWILSKQFKVMKRKALLAVIRDAPYDAGVRIRDEYRLEFQGEELSAIVYRSCLVEAGQEQEELSRDRYVRISDNEFAVDDKEISSLNYGFKYICDSDGKILVADVHRYSNKNPDGVHREFTWNYDQTGRPTAVKYDLNGSIYSLQSYIYQDDNLAETNANIFVYDDATLVNNPFAPDAAHAFDMMHYKDEPFLYFPYLLGRHPFNSKLLPDGYMAISGLTSRAKVPFSYDFDEDGYIKSMTWVSDRTDHTDIIFEYQE